LPILVDSGPIVADADRRDAAHGRVRGFLDQVDEPLLVPITVLPEVCHLLERQLGSRAEVAFVESLVRGELRVQPISVADLERAAQLMTHYLDLPLGFVDSTVIALAERLNITRIRTLDHRHFTVVRPRHTPAFELLP